jgi:acetolactate synthase-1/2/3 large subunit
MAGPKKSSLDRRRFLKTAAAAGAATLAVPQLAKTGAAQAPAPVRAAGVPPMVHAAENAVPPELDPLTLDTSGSDFMVDVLKSLDIEYIASNPGSSFRGLQESFINYGGNKNPEWLTCTHEESSVAIAHGYAKIEGKPMCIMAHGTVGLQHAAMAIYNAYCDRVPVYIILGNTFDATKRRPGAEWVHSVQDAAAMVRDYIKWDDMPISLPHFAESAVRAYKIAMTPPMAPVIIVADSELQEQPVPEGEALRVPKLTIPKPPAGDAGAVAEIARLLVAAENPVIIADRVARTPAGMQYLTELADTLQAAVIDQRGRVNMPSRHPLVGGGGGALSRADVILGLELDDYFGAVTAVRDQLHRTFRPQTKSGAKFLSISTEDLYQKSNYQDFQRFLEVDVAVAADAEATLPSLIEAVKKLLTDDRRRLFQERGAKIAEANRAARARVVAEMAYAWDASPISTARMSAEIWEQIRNEDWSLVNGGARPLWNFDKHYRAIGGSGGSGVGYGAPASVGAALANKKHGRLSVSIQNDGDLMYGPGVLWTAAHHRIPLLSVMHNNRAYHQEVMHLQRMANRHQRDITTAPIGNVLTDPNINYAQLAKSLGVHGEGPITDPKELAPALKRAIEVVKRGEPALVDVVTQPR